MKIQAYFLAVLLFLSIGGCNSSGDSAGEGFLTATINGEEWEFIDVSANRTSQGLEITGTGYIGGDEATAPVNLKIEVVGVPVQGEIPTPYEASFAVNTEIAAAIATIIPEDEPLVFETALDPNVDGRFVITEADENSISGRFNFIATDKGGRSQVVTNGRINDLPL